MRHRKSFNHLGRTSSHREAMLSNMAASLIMHKRINTTLAKAKALRSYVEPLISRSKEDTTHNRRMVFSYLQNKEAVTELFRNISQKIAERPGGYTRIFKLGSRTGDNAEMCLIELVDFNDTYVKDSKSAGTKAKTRRGRGRKKSEDADTPEVHTAARKKDAVIPPPAITAAPEVVETPDTLVTDTLTESPEIMEQPDAQLTDATAEAVQEETPADTQEDKQVDEHGETPQQA